VPARKYEWRLKKATVVRCQGVAKPFTANLCLRSNQPCKFNIRRVEEGNQNTPKKDCKLILQDKCIRGGRNFKRGSRTPVVREQGGYEIVINGMFSAPFVEVEKEWEGW